MSTPHEGQRVAYIGHPGEHGIGDEGKVLSPAGSGCHVLWATGLRKGQIDLVPNADITPLASRRTAEGFTGWDDALDGPLVSVAVRDVYESEGDVGLLNALIEEGHVASLTEAAQEALETVAARIRTDASFRAVLAQLEPDEGDEFVTLTAATILRDSFGGES